VFVQIFDRFVLEPLLRWRIALSARPIFGCISDWKPGQISPPVTMEKQEAVFRSLQAYAAQSGVSIEQKSDP
jgi:hypothetical protein